MYDDIIFLYLPDDENDADGKSSDKDDKKTSDKKKKEEKKKKTEEKKEEKKKEFKPKTETIKVPLEFTVTLEDMIEPSEKTLGESREKLKALNEHDELKKKRETALNNLESFVIDVRDKLYQVMRLSRCKNLSLLTCILTDLS